MKVQYVSEYLALAEKGLCPRLDCPMDKGPLLTNLDINDRVILYCISCDWKTVLGLQLYNQIKLEVNKHLLLELKKDGDIEFEEKAWNKNN
jgi:hypothetical protein